MVNFKTPLSVRFITLQPLRLFFTTLLVSQCTISTALTTPSLKDVLNNRNLITRTTRSTTNSLPKPSHHYNDITPISLLISLNTIHDITPPTTPDLQVGHTTHTSLLNDCFLSVHLPFLCNRTWDLTKPPSSYHEATTWPDSNVWLSAMQREFDSIESRKAFERMTLLLVANQLVSVGHMTINITLMAQSYGVKKRHDWSHRVLASIRRTMAKHMPLLSNWAVSDFSSLMQTTMT